MWKELGLDNVKKGLDNFVKKAATAVSDQPLSNVAPQYVCYTVRFAPKTVDHYLNDDDVEQETSLFYVPIQDRPLTVGDIRSHFPFKTNSCSFRFKIEDDLFRHVFLEGLKDTDIAPTYKGRIFLDLLICPIPLSAPAATANRASTVNGKKETRPVTQAPSREELIRQREEAKAAQVKAAREFAAANANEEANRRREKLCAQNQLGAVIDKWALTEQGKFKDVRSLLSSMNTVLWDNSGWTDVPLGELMISDATVKKTYRKAIVLCHPDRHQKESADQQYRADRIFNAINEAYKNFTSSSGSS